MLLPEEAKALEDAAVKLISDFAEHKPAAPTDPDDAELLVRYQRDMARGAEAVCELFKMLCAKRPQLLRRFCEVFLEEGQDADIKARVRCLCSPCLAVRSIPPAVHTKVPLKLVNYRVGGARACAPHR